VLKGKIERVEGPTALVAIGDARIPVQVAGLNKPTPNAAVDLFVRCERLAITTAKPIAFTGRISALIHLSGRLHRHPYRDPSGRRR